MDYLLILFKKITVDPDTPGRLIVETHYGATCLFYFDTKDPVASLAALYWIELETLRIMDEMTIKTLQKAS